MVIDYSEHWQMKLSPSKCSIMHIKTKAQCPINNQFVYHIGQTKLPVVDCVTDIGVTYTYSNRLNFSPHVDNIVAKASLRAKLTLKFRCFQSRNPVLLTKAFCAFVPPINS